MSIRSRAGLAVGCVAVGAFLATISPTPQRITFLAVGQGDCAVIQAGGRTILVDTGPTTPGFDSGSRVLLPKLRELGVDRVDLVVLSHPDLDHVGGTEAVLRRFPEAKLATSATFRQDPEMRSHLKAWRVSEDRVSWLTSASIGRIGDLRLRLSCPPPSEEANDGSVFLQVGRPGAQVVLTGDASEAVEVREMRKADWSATVLKAGHHGSKTSSGNPWLAATRPKWVVVSCGRDNRYGHPHPDVLTRIATSGATLARTDREGDVQFEWRPEGLIRTR